MGNKPLSVTCCEYLLPPCGWSFPLFVMPSEEQKFLISNKSNVSIFFFCGWLFACFSVFSLRSPSVPSVGQEGVPCSHPLRAFWVFLLELSSIFVGLVSLMIWSQDPFVERFKLSPMIPPPLMHVQCPYMKNGSICELSVLLPWSTCLSPGQYHPELIMSWYLVVLVLHLHSHSRLSWLFLALWTFTYIFKSVYHSYTEKKLFETLIGIQLGLYRSVQGEGHCSWNPSIMNMVCLYILLGLLHSFEKVWHSLHSHLTDL